MSPLAVTTPTLDTIAAVENSVAELKTAIDSLLPLAIQAKQLIPNLVIQVTFSDGSHGLTWNLIRTCNGAAARRSHDVEIAITDEYASSVFAGKTLDPIKDEVKGVHIAVQPTGPPQIRFGGDPAKRDWCFIELPLIISVSDGTERSLVMRIPAVFVVSPASSELKIMQTAAVGYFNPTNQLRIDPLEGLPLPMDSRRTLRSHITQAIQNRLKALSVTLPQVPVGSKVLPIQPHSYTISKDLDLIVRTLPKRRTSYPLASRVLSGFDRQIRLKNEHILPQIRKRVEDEHVEVKSLECREGFIYLKVHKTVEIPIPTPLPVLTIVTVKVDVEYAITIKEKSGGVLLLDSRETGRNITVEVQDALPGTADWLLKKFTKLATEEVDKHEHESFDFADLRPDVVAALGLIEPFGIRIITRMRR